MKRNELKVAIASPNFIDVSRILVWINPLDSIQSSPGGLDGTEWNLSQQQILHWTVLRNVQVSRISVVGCSDTETCLRSASAPRPPAHAQYVLDDC